MIPSVDAYLINQLELRQDVVRLPVTEMGCAGGTSALIYANEFLKGRPEAKIAILALEAPSLTLLKNDHSIENLVSAAIFSDGASCVLVSNEETQGAPKIEKTEMYHFPESTHLMGYNLQNDGLKIVLDREVPNAIIDHVPAIFDSFYKELSFDLSKVDHLVFHPGGKKIVRAVEELVTPLGKNLDCSKQVLKSFGNMSSATVVHVLELVQKEFYPQNQTGHMLAFGPGFSAQSLLIKWS